MLLSSLVSCLYLLNVASIHQHSAVTHILLFLHILPYPRLTERPCAATVFSFNMKDVTSCVDIISLGNKMDLSDNPEGPLVCLLCGWGQQDRESLSAAHPPIRPFPYYVSIFTSFSGPIQPPRGKLYGTRSRAWNSWHASSPISQRKGYTICTAYDTLHQKRKRSPQKSLLRGENK